MDTSRTLFVLATTVVGGLALQSLAADADSSNSTPQQQMQGAKEQMQGAKEQVQGQMRGAQQQMQGTQGQDQNTQAQGMGTVIEAPAVTTTFTVQNVDKANRTVTLKGADGSTETVKCGPEVRNFDQIKTGDQVRATVVDEIGVAINPSGQPGMGETQTVAVAPKGAKPGMVMIQTREVTGKILAIDQNKRVVSVEGPAGQDRSIKVGSKVDLSQLKKGDSVTLQVAQGMMISVQSPGSSAQPAGGTMTPDDTQSKGSNGRE